jgi:hypothetical protein
VQTLPSVETGGLVPSAVLPLPSSRWLPAGKLLGTIYMTQLSAECGSVNIQPGIWVRYTVIHLNCVGCCGGKHYMIE